MASFPLVFVVSLICSSYGLLIQISSSAHEMQGQALVDHINNAQSSWVAKFSPISEEEMKFKVMDSRFAEPLEADTLEGGTPDGDVNGYGVPETFDARSVWPKCNSINLIRNQAYCGACWAFGAAEVISDRICIRSGGAHQPVISVEDILSCCGSSCGQGCQGGYPLEAMNFWNKYGVVTGGDYNGLGCSPYSYAPCATCEQAKGAPKCKKECQSEYGRKYQDDKLYGKSAYRLFTTTKSAKIATDAVPIIQNEILTNGPVVASYNVYEDFYHYKSGVYHYVSGKLVGGHAVKIIGWGTENKVDYWLVANSWGTSFGDNGFFKIRRGTNECNFEMNIIAGMTKSGVKTGFSIFWFLLVLYHLF